MIRNLSLWDGHVPVVLDLFERVLHWAVSLAPSSSVVHSESPSGPPSRGRERRLCLKLDQPVKTAMAGGAGSEGGVTGKLKASMPLPPTFGVPGSSNLCPLSTPSALEKPHRQPYALRTSVPWICRCWPLTRTTARMVGSDPTWRPL